MKSIDDALELRGRIFGSFAMAELVEDEEQRARLMTFVVVGAGATGVEMAGQIGRSASSAAAAPRGRSPSSRSLPVRRSSSSAGTSLRRCLPGPDPSVNRSQNGRRGKNLRTETSVA